MKHLGSQFHPISLTCGKCKSHLRLSLELMEFLINTEKEFEGDDPFDRAIAEAIRGNGHGLICSPMAKFPIAIDVKDGSLAMIGWCPICKEVRLAGITPNELRQMIADIRKESEDEISGGA